MKKRERTNGLLAVELFSGECHFQANKTAKSQQVAEYLAELATYYRAGGFERLQIFLDRSTTHLAKMQNAFGVLTEGLGMQVRFHLMAPYWPALNLVEYTIHLIRLKALHHVDCKRSLSEFETMIKELCDNPRILTNEQIVNILEHIESFVPNL